MNEINVEKIMNEIRAQLPEEEGAWATLRFEDIPIDGTLAPGSRESRFDREEFERCTLRAAETASVPFFREVDGNALVRFAKKVVRKLIRFCVEPITRDVTAFEDSAGRSLRLLRRFVQEQSLAMERQEEEIALLRERIAALEKRLEAAEKKA